MQVLKKWSRQIGIGGFSWLTLISGFSLWLFGRRGHPLILRDESTLLGVPASFVWAGILISAAVLLIFERAVCAQKRKILWGWQGGVSSRRGGPVQWEDIIFSCVMGGTVGTVGAALWMNATLDRTCIRSYSTTITRAFIRGGGGTHSGVSYFIEVADWKRPQHTVHLPLSRLFYITCRVGQKRTVQTKNGLLDYEWLVDVK